MSQVNCNMYGEKLKWEAGVGEAQDATSKCKKDNIKQYLCVSCH
jgi:hypothetical protein